MKRTVRSLVWLSAPLLLAAPVMAALAQGSPPPGNPLELKFDTPSPERGATVSGRCQGCHGQGLISTNPNIPSLAGQIPSYLRLQLAAFRAKLRPSPVMQNQAANLSDQDIVDIAAYASSQKPGPAWKSDNADLRAKGQGLFMAGDAARNIIACAICHGATGRGLDANGVASITNLSPDYAWGVLHEFRDSPGFGGIPHPEAMRIALKPMTDDDLKAVIAYISSMQP